MPHIIGLTEAFITQDLKNYSRMQKGYEYFSKNYEILKQTNSFYCIEKRSKVTSKNMQVFKNN